MSVYAQLAEVITRNPYRALDASTVPSSGDVQRWLDDAEARINGTLARAGITAPAAGSSGARILGTLACDYADGRVRRAFAGAGGDGRNDDGKAELDRFAEALADILRDPVGWGAALSATPASAAASQLRSHVTDNDEGKSPSDYAPTFTKDDLL